MSRFRLFKIIACFVLTFVLGLASGWLLKPPAPESSLERSRPSSQRLMENLDATLKLTPEQKTKLEPLLAEWQREVEQVLRRPRRRRELFEEYASRIREHLTVEQQVEFDRLVAKTGPRFEKRTR